MYANKIGYSDVTPFEVIKMNTEKKFLIRAMKVQLDKSWTPECNVGGFCANVSNNHEQKWTIESDESGRQTFIRKHKDGKWYDEYHDRYSLSEAPHKFYDYNF